MSKKDTCLVIATDLFVVDYAKTLLKSVSANYSGTEKLKVFVLSPEDTHHKAVEFVFSNLDIEFVYPENVRPHEESGFVAKMYKNRSYTGTSLYRYFVGSVCLDYKKAVYIDVDCIIARNIQPLLDYKLGNAPIAAFPEIQLSFPDNPTFRDTSIFNSGVMVIDLDYFRENNIEDVLMDVSMNFKDWLGYADQDVFNVVFKNNWSTLSINFNYLTNIYKSLPVLDPVVVHFAGISKPWLSNAKDTQWVRLWRSYHEH
jgi:lipopolysaccharide biosynthesis glycosyltransferase